jgi:hypothetical protein
MPESSAGALNHFRSRMAMIAVLALLAANIVVPLLWGDVYPFTSAPMFRDTPTKFCNYRVYSPAGDELAVADWRLQRIYDGNPLGYGVGVRPPPVIEQEFGVIHDEAAVRRHTEQQFERPENARFDYVEVVQEVIGPIDTRHVGVMEARRWKVERPKSEL